MSNGLIKRTEMRLRKLSPDVVRRAYRLVRGLRAVQSGAAFPAELMTDCRFCPSREALVAQLPAAGQVAELGTYKGDFARHILAANRPARLHLVDIDFTHFRSQALDGPEVTRHEGLTHEVIATFPDAHFDWVYVDGDHSYEGCLRDARAAAPKIRPGGYLVFNDFAHIDPWMGRYGVHRAATDFARQAGWAMAFFSYEPNGLYDAAFRRPDEPGAGASPHLLGGAASGRR